MNYADYKISLDVRSISSNVALECKKRETLIRVYVTLTEGVKPYTIGGNCRPVFTAKKPDGNILFNDCSIEGNFIVYTFTEQTATAAGMMNCEIRLYGEDNGLLVSASFRILVHDAVYDDDDVVESVTEITTLTSLISEATALINDVNSKLENGDFVPKLEIGEVKTLPAGSNATASITGSGEAPILNLGIPMGEQGQAEGMIPDAELSLESTKPVQNKVITAELNEIKKDKQPVGSYVQYAAQKLSDEEKAQARANIGAGVSSFDGSYSSLSGKPTIDTELSGSSTNAVQNKAVNAALGNKVDKVTGKGLSTNDFTTKEKEKLAGIEAGANKYVLEDGAVTGEKIAQGAICVGAASFTLSSAGWTLNDKGVYEQEKTTTLGVSPEKHIGFLGLTRGLLHYPGDGNSSWAWSQSVIAAEREKIACLYSASLIATNTIKFVATEIPNGSLYVTILFFRR